MSEPAPPRSSIASTARVARCRMVGFCCRRVRPRDSGEPEPETWSVTAWGERYEVFPEVDLCRGLASPRTPTSPFSRLRGAYGGQRRDRPARPRAASRCSPPQSRASPGSTASTSSPTAPASTTSPFASARPPARRRSRAAACASAATTAPGGLDATPPPPDSDAGDETPFLPQGAAVEDGVRDRLGTAGQARASGAGGARATPGGGEACSPPRRRRRAAQTLALPGARSGRGAVLFRSRRGSRAGAAFPSSTPSRGSPGGLAARARLARLEELLKLEAASRREVEEARRAPPPRGSPRRDRRDLAAATAAREGGARRPPRCARPWPAGRGRSRPRRARPSPPVNRSARLVEDRPGLARGATPPATRACAAQGASGV